MALKIINCCPHPISVISGSVYNPTTRKNHGGKEILHFPASGTLASARSSVEVISSMELNGVPVPTVKRTFSEVTNLPEDRNTLYLVSSVFAQASKELGKDTSNLVTPYGTVYNDEGEVVGCTALVRYA